MNREETLYTAISYITKDRAATHGNAEDNFAKVSDLWNWWLKNRECQNSPLDAADISMMMVLFKIARISGNANHNDNYVDLAGYAALACEITNPD